MIGITQAEETSSDIVIGSCLVNPQKFICSVSILNTNEGKAETQVPQIIIENIATDAFVKEFPINPIKGISEPLLSREEKIKNLLRKSFKS